jgi:hypothetical protein
MGGTVPQGNLTPQVGELDAAINAAAAAAREQEFQNVLLSSKVAKAQEQKERLVVRWVLPMTAFAKLMLSEDPELRNTLRAKKYRTYEGVTVVALALANHFEQHKARYVAAGWKEDTADQVRSEVNELRRTIAEREVHLGLRREATVTLEREYARGRRLVRYIDRLLRSEWAKSPEKLERWKTLTRFPTSGKPKAKPDGATSEKPASGGNTSTDHNAA